MSKLKITGTFLDEISHDIPSQNWGYKEWDADFQEMKLIGIDTLILIRSGYRRWLTYPSKILTRYQGCYMPSENLLDNFLKLSDKYNMNLFIGLYDSGEYWHKGEYGKEIELGIRVAEELWEYYGNFAAFKGWYIPYEVSRNLKSITEIYAELGKYCKNISSNLPVLISPYIEGEKAVQSYSQKIIKRKGITLDQHENEWGEIMKAISGAVDIIAFQDGHINFHDLPDFLKINKELAEKNNLKCWTNIEAFDRDMPIKFPPIKWEKMLLKLEAATKMNIEKAITFEFSHFMSPNSCYLQAHGLYNRYKEYLS